MPGWRRSALDGSDTAVFIGAFAFDSLLAASQPDHRPLASSHTAIGVSLTIVANRLSYFFGFRGPSVAFDTACSSSLVAAPSRLPEPAATASAPWPWPAA